MTNGERTLPSGWRWVRLGDVCEQDRTIVEPNTVVAANLPYLSLEHIESNTGKILRHPSEAVEDEGKSTTFAFDSRHILYGKLRPYLNKVALPDFEGRCTTELIPFLPVRTDREYLAWTLRRQETVEAAMRDKTGSRMPRANLDDLLSLEIPLPPLDEQKRIAALLNEQMAAVEKARAAAQAQLEAADHLIEAYIRDSLSRGVLQRLPLGDVLTEVVTGVGDRWKDYPVIGATRDGLAPAKEKVGKNPGRYKLADAGTIFYNPMRINIGSIAMVDDDDEPGITSPDYVVVKGKPGMVHPRWFYYWFRSNYGEAFIKTFARGAVRERLMFTRLKPGQADLPSWDVQNEIAEKLKAVSVLKERVTNQLADIEQLPGALLRRAFAGEL